MSANTERWSQDKTLYEAPVLEGAVGNVMTITKAMTHLIQKTGPYPGIKVGQEVVFRVRNYGGPSGSSGEIFVEDISRDIQWRMPKNFFLNSTAVDISFTVLDGDQLVGQSAVNQYVIEHESK